MHCGAQKGGEILLAHGDFHILPVLKVYENLPSDILGVGDIVDRENYLSKMCCNLHRPGAFSILEPTTSRAANTPLRLSIGFRR